MAAFSSPSVATAAGSGNVLSDKVGRALHVRTDTPAMRAALDALANLPSGDDFVVGGGKHGGGSGSSVGGVIDARSVRAAIEKDALRRALDFQSELQKLSRDATALRERVNNVARAAALVGERVESQIVDISQSHMSETPDNERHATSVESTEREAAEAWEEERNLASSLASAQRSYVEAAKRQRAVDAFLDKFDLGEDEARLLDHYNFGGFVASDNYLEPGEGGDPWAHPGAALNVIPNPTAGAVHDAMAFLNALERLTVIRRELTKTFGRGDANSHRDYGTTGGDEGLGSGQLGTHSALRMMEQLASRQERANERIYQFIQFFLGIGSAAPSSNTMMIPTSSSDTGRSISASDVASQAALGRFRDGDEMDEAYTHPVIRRSLHVLRWSPSRRAHALELIAAGRRTEVTRRFLLALTSGYGGMAPLEMRAHDPVGYVGDMLAFAFRAFRVEGELVRTLFMWNHQEGKDGEDGENKADGEEPSSQYAMAEGEEKQLDNAEEEDENNRSMGITAMLAQSMGGLSRPLRMRVSQVVSSLASQGGDDSGAGDRVGANDEDDETSSCGSLNRLVALFSVCGLLRFYGSAVRKALDKLEASSDAVGVDPAESPLFTTCEECLSEAADSYVASLRAFGAMLGIHSLGSAESEAQLAHRAIVRIAEERVASPGFAEDTPSSSKEEDVASKQLSLPFLVGTMIDKAMPHLRMLDDSAALKSAISVASKCGLEAGESAKWSELIQKTEKNLVERFVDTETDEVLEVCGLERLRSAFRHMNAMYIEGMTMASHPGLSQEEVELAMKRFYSSLFSPPIPTFEDMIKDPELRKIARTKTAERVADVYRELYEAITSDKGGYAALEFLGHDPDQVKTLLSL